jgi:hypothetical protein
MLSNYLMNIIYNLFYLEYIFWLYCFIYVCLNILFRDNYLNERIKNLAIYYIFINILIFILFLCIELK